MRLKRLVDSTGAAAALLLMAPILAALAVAIRLFLGRPVLFRQTRPGYLEKPFIIYKFRTMRETVDSQGIPFPDGERLEPLGNFLRRMSFDELPELYNVLKGDMSLVGPRPLLPEYLPRYTEQQRRRHQVKPGITGWAQINGRNTLTWEEKFDLDLWYVENRSITLDLKILWLTLVKVIRREGINAIGSATMPEYMGPLSGSAAKTERLG